jgi:hypothetical protein
VDWLPCRWGILPDNNRKGVKREVKIDISQNVTQISHAGGRRGHGGVSVRVGSYNR